MTNITYFSRIRRDESSSSDRENIEVPHTPELQDANLVHENLEGSKAIGTVTTISTVIGKAFFGCARAGDEEETNSENQDDSRWGERTRSEPMPTTLRLSTFSELVASGWPSWLSGVAAEAIMGWTPRGHDTYDKLAKIGQGIHSFVYKARDRFTGKIVALKKVRVDTSDPESVKFMAREILILRRLDHPNVVKLEGLAISRMMYSLYLVFEYMERDLADLATSPGIKFTVPQVKCYMHQMLSGLEHCHNHGVLHHDINGSNLLLDNRGILKIAGFGSASFFEPNLKQPSTSLLVTPWYRSPELLLGSTNYGEGVDLWSTGCVLAELLAGKPIMPGGKEVDQLEKIFKLCGSPSEEYWKKLKLKKLKPPRPYKPCFAERLEFENFPPSSLPLIQTLLAINPAERRTASAALRSEFFRTEPYACEPSSLPLYSCEPSSLPLYSPGKEMNARRRGKEPIRY